MSTPSVEDYVKAIHKAQLASSDVTTQQIAERVGVTAPAVSKMLRRLAALNLVAHTKYMGVQLTRAGEKVALEIVRHHRLLEQYLVQALGTPAVSDMSYRSHRSYSSIHNRWRAPVQTNRLPTRINLILLCGVKQRRHQLGAYHRAYGASSTLPAPIRCHAAQRSVKEANSAVAAIVVI